MCTMLHRWDKIGIKFDHSVRLLQELEQPNHLGPTETIPLDIMELRIEAALQGFLTMVCVIPNQNTAQDLVEDFMPLSGVIDALITL